METNLRIQKIAFQPNIELGFFIMQGCTEFLIGWRQGFGNIHELFVFPSNKEEHPSP